MIPFAQLLGEATGRIWPKRIHQEALFDLPERKRWSTADHTAAVANCAAWLMANGVVVQADISPSAAHPLTLAEARARLAPIADRTPEVTGVARDLQAIAPLVGAAPKTLANSLRRFAQARRTDHRWLLALARLMASPVPLGLCFEDRSQAAVLGLLERAAGHAVIEQLDALDALTLFSLITVWQRRRPTQAVRANRARASKRRDAPKPLVRLLDTLIQPVQGLALLGVEQPGVRALAMESVLTRAHLAPHGDRQGRTPAPPRLLQMLAPHLRGDEPRQVMLRFRVAVMEAWRTRGAWPDPPFGLANHPYVSMTIALARQARGGRLTEAALAERWQQDWAGKAMLAPVIRHRMQIWGDDGERGRILRAMDQ